MRTHFLTAFGFIAAILLLGCAAQVEVPDQPAAQAPIQPPASPAMEEPKAPAAPSESMALKDPCIGMMVALELGSDATDEEQSALASSIAKSPGNYSSGLGICYSDLLSSVRAGKVPAQTCQVIMTPSVRTECESYIALSKEDPGYCQTLPDATYLGNSGAEISMRDGCQFMYVLGSLEPTLVSGSELSEGMRGDMEDACGAIGDDELKGECLLAVAYVDTGE